MEDLPYSAEDIKVKQEPNDDDTPIYSWKSERFLPINFQPEVKIEKECSVVGDSDLISDDQDHSDSCISSLTSEVPLSDFKQEIKTEGELSKIYVSDLQMTDDQALQLNNETESKKEIVSECIRKSSFCGCFLCDVQGVPITTESNKICSNFSANDSPNKYKTYKCDMCERSFNHKHHLKRHILSVHEHFRPFKCPDCDFASSQKKDLVIHTKSVHERLKPFNCDKCDFVFSQKPHLTNHIKNIHEKLKPFKCSKCNYSCSTKSRLSIHNESVHEKFRPFKCLNCDYASNRKKDLCCHIKTVHEKLRPFICGVCGNKLSTKASLIAHIMSIHEKGKPT